MLPALEAGDFVELMLHNGSEVKNPCSFWISNPVRLFVESHNALYISESTDYNLNGNKNSQDDYCDKAKIPYIGIIMELLCISMILIM
jgi:hypothetical protein